MANDQRPTNFLKSIAFTWIFFFIITYIYNLIQFYTVFLFIK